ncbi:MAG: YggT family protein [Epulopiscium sp.]|jgi:YggT family protein|nr:YggT family protein [Candidatus Epulonipiscium sp.]
MQGLLSLAVDYFFSLLEFLIFIRIILSWLPIGRDNSIIRMLYALTEPILAPLREMLNRSPLGGGMLDFSPFIAFILMRFVQSILHGLIGLL